MSQGFIKLNRSEGIELLEEDPKAFLLLTQIALRARRTDAKYSKNSLKINQAFLGDHRKIGLSRQEYRSAQKRLEKHGLAHFEPKNKGTIATLISSEVFDINADNQHLKKPPNLPMENQEKEPTKNQPKTSNNTPMGHQLFNKGPLTKMKELQESNKATTSTLVDGVELYPCLEKLVLSVEEKKSLMIYSENRVGLAIEWTKQTSIKKSLIGTLHWHCKQAAPPPLTDKTSLGMSQQQLLAVDYNRFLEDQGYMGLAVKNQDAVSNNFIHVVLDGYQTTISLNNSIETIKNDLNKSKQEILNNKSKNISKE